MKTQTTSSATIIFKKNENGQLLSFVVINKAGELKGVDKDRRCPKKIVVVGKNIDPKSITAGIVYNCQLEEMYGGKGYKCVSAQVVTHPASIEMIHVTKAVYQITIVWGKSRFIFDPKDGNKPSVKDINEAVRYLSTRKDVANKATVIKEFVEKASELKKQLSEELPTLF